MSTTVNYKGNTIATLSNETKTLTTAGTWVEGNIEIVDTKDNPTLQSKISIDPTTSSQTITADSGYDGLSSVQINAMPTGTAGTPSATKGTVSNHQISVTPSVTNTAGYISGGTKTGTAVTVTASELASGNKEITSNGTGIDVVGYSTVSVSVPSSSTALITDTTDAAGGTVRTITTTDEVYLQTKTITPTSSQQTVLPDTGYDGFSSVIVGASSGGTPSATAHTIYFEFSDETDTTITAYYDNSFISDAITATTPTTYNNKTVTLAQLDGTTWYEVSSGIPLNTQLVDYNAVTAGYYVHDDGSIVTGDPWNCITDYIPIDSSMTFSFVSAAWYGIGFYNSSKSRISGYISNDIPNSTVSGDYVQGTLTSSVIPSNAAYVVLTGNPYSLNANTLSLIRTA